MPQNFYWGHSTPILWHKISNGNILENFCSLKEWEKGIPSLLPVTGEWGICSLLNKPCIWSMIICVAFHVFPLTCTLNLPREKLAQSTGSQYSWSSVFLVVRFYKVATNIELVNSESLLLGEITGLGFCNSLVTMFSSTNQYITHDAACKRGLWNIRWQKGCK